MNFQRSVWGVTLALASVAQAQVPSQMVMPTNGTGWSNATGSPGHTSTGGIGGADDTKALDLNLNVPSWDADFGRPVYATADGWVERNIGGGGWSNSTYGQILLKHRNPDGSVYYCGYLHMSGITSLKATQGAYVQAGTVLGYVNHVSPSQPMANHLHMACYIWNGSKLVSQPMAINTNLLQVNARPNFSTVGGVTINGKAVAATPHPVTRFTPFTLATTLRNLSGYAKSTRFRLVMTRDQAGSDYVGLVAPLASVACSSLNDQASVLQTFNNPGFSSPAGNYWLQIYFDDCSSPFAALKRVAGSPIAIKLQ